MHFDLEQFISSFGYLGVWVIISFIFFESFLLFFLPGDSLLFLGGFYAFAGKLDIWILVVGCFIAAVLGNNVGYVIGQRFGLRLFQRKNSKLFTKKNLALTQNFYKKNGGKTIVLARFIPGIRTFAPIVAGIGTMKYQTFLFYNLVGAALWAIGLPLAGYFLGTKINPKVVENNLLLITGGIIFFSLLPSILHVVVDNKVLIKKTMVSYYHRFFGNPKN
jgi:membrane-associated protein